MAAKSSTCIHHVPYYLLPVFLSHQPRDQHAYNQPVVRRQTTSTTTTAHIPPVVRTMGSLDVIPFWQVNCPQSELTADCPPFLAGLSEKDQRIVGTPDAAFRVLTWDEVAAIIQENRLELFQRVPSDLRRYKAFTFKLARQYGSIAAFVLRERLRWQEPIQPRAPPFQNADDIKILWNDWPYGIDKRIAHLVVWTKFELKTDSTTGDLTEQARTEIDDFVARTFRSRVPEKHVSCPCSSCSYSSCLLHWNICIT